MGQIRLAIPEQFELVNRTWRVAELTDEKLEELRELWDKPELVLWGLCEFETATILLKPSKDKDHMMHTFLHELLHAMLYSMGRQLDENAEEALADGVGGTLHQFLKTKQGTFNPKVPCAKAKLAKLRGRK
jgi:hypothetical protein